MKSFFRFKTIKQTKNCKSFFKSHYLKEKKKHTAKTIWSARNVIYTGKLKILTFRFYLASAFIQPGRANNARKHYVTRLSSSLQHHFEPHNIEQKRKQ